MSGYLLRGEMFFHKPQLPLKVLHRDPEIPFTLHQHDFYELVVVVAGNGTHLQKGGGISISGGNIFLVRPGVSHGYGQIDGLELYNVLIGEKALKPHIKELREISGFDELFLHEVEEIPIAKLNSHQLAEIMVLVNAIRLESERQDISYGAGTMAYAKLLQLIIAVCRLHSAHRRVNIITDARLESVIAYMEQNLDRSLSLKEIASYSAMSISTLNRQFKLATGWSPIDYHIHRRILYAARLLLTTDLSMELVSDRTGFSDANYFARQFRTHMQMSPRQYKQLWKTSK